MARQKLSAAERGALRREALEGIKAGTETARVVEDLAAKYGVSGEMVRYYMKGGKKPARKKKAPPKRKAAPKKKARRGAKKAAKRGRPRKRKAAKRGPGRPPKAAPGRPSRLMAFLHSASEAVVRKAIAAKKILPRLERQLHLKEKLQAVQRKTASALRRAAERARELRKRIARLTHLYL